jgi:tetratricopeptide (TPR) repeat protein
MAIEGPLRELGIHDVFQLLDLSKKTGVLKVTSDLRQNAGTLYFDDGAVVYAEIRSNPHPLGTMLLRSGRITDGDLERARAMQNRGDDPRRVGEILVAIGAITQRELDRQLRFQVEEVVFEVMSWNEGYFSFEEGSPEYIPAETTGRIRVEAVLMEGARRIDEWSRIEKRIPHLGVVPMLSPPPTAGADGAGRSGGELDLLPPEWEVLALIDGRRDVRALAAALGRSDFDVAKTLFGLDSAGVITLVEPGGTPQTPGSSLAEVAELAAQAEDGLRRRDFEPARAAAERAVALQPHNATVHLLLGRLHLAAGRAPAALDALRRAVRLDPEVAAVHRFMGYALAQAGRFQEAVDAWDQWERLAGRAGGRDESAFVNDVRRARDAARVLAGSGALHA